jgi:hypothetical protein
MWLDLTTGAIFVLLGVFHIGSARNWTFGRGLIFAPSGDRPRLRIVLGLVTLAFGVLRLATAM